jgi:multisubunit Na+/H+ antiporter MnhG subunit
VSRARPAPSFLIAAAAGVLVIVTSVLDFAADGDLRIFDAESQWSWSHVLATAAFAGGAVVALRQSRREEDPTRRHLWLAASVLFCLLLVDNVTRLHTHTKLWPLLYAPILIGLSTAIWRLSRETREAGVVAAGLVALFVSVTFHIVGPWVVHALGRGKGSWAYEIKASLKESTELAGWMLVVPGLWRLHRGRQAAARKRSWVS